MAAIDKIIKPTMPIMSTFTLSKLSVNIAAEIMSDQAKRDMVGFPLW